MNRIQQYLNQPVNGSNLALFRILFGLLTFRQTLEIQYFAFELELSKFTFPYEHFEFIQPYSHSVIMAMVTLALISSLVIATGWKLRVFCWVYILSFGYLFLLDQTFYNNHYYLWLLMAFLLSFTQAGNYLAFPKARSAMIPRWNYTIFQLLLLVVYFYAGMAKLRPDWLAGQQMHIHLAAQGFNSMNLAKFMSWAALLFDLLIGFVLIIRPRWPVLLVAVAFHLYNYFTFSIGIFPLVMIASLVLYIQPITFWQKWLKNKERAVTIIDELQPKQWRVYVLLLFFVIQVLVPLQRFLLKEDNSWNQQLYLFSWNLMANEWVQKDFKLTVLDPAQDKIFILDPLHYVSVRQYRAIDDNPKLLAQFARKIKEYNQMDASQKVRVYSLIEFNGHEETLLVDPEIDMGAVDFKYFGPNPWINPQPR